MQNWLKLISDKDGRYDLSVRDNSGKKYSLKPPFPDLKIEKSNVEKIKGIYHHLVEATATTDENELPVFISRIVIVLDSGAEMELMRTVVPKEIIETDVDITKCNGCGGNIILGEAKIVTDKQGNKIAIHGRCELWV